MKLYLWTACAVILAAPVYKANSAPNANVEFKFNRDKVGGVNNGGLKNLTLKSNAPVNCTLNLGFSFDGCDEDNLRECSAITGTLTCDYFGRNEKPKTYTANIAWKVSEADPEANPNITNPYNIAACSVHRSEYLAGCLTHALRDKLQLFVHTNKEKMTFSGSIEGCAGCKTE